MPQITQIQVRRDTAANWTSTNPTLAEGEIGFETNTGKFKIGAKVATVLQTWTQLPYATDASYITGTTLPASITSASGLATVGTITTGTWNGGVIPGQYGGTGVANTGKTITVSGNTTIGSSAHTVTMTTSANTAITLPTSGTLVGSADSKTVTAAMLADYATAPTLWYAPSANMALNGGGGIAASTAGAAGLTNLYDCFNLTKGVTGLTPNSLYLVEYYILGNITNITSQTQKVNLGITGDSVSTFNFHVAYGSGGTQTAGAGTFANSNNAYVNLKDTTLSIGGTGTIATAGSFAIRMSGILRTGASATDNNFQVKLGVSISSSTTLTVLRESFGSLRLIGATGSTALPTTGSWTTI